MACADLYYNLLDLCSAVHGIACAACIDLHLWCFQWLLLGKVPTDPKVASKRWLWPLRQQIFGNIAGSPLNGLSGLLWGEAACILQHLSSSVHPVEPCKGLVEAGHSRHILICSAGTLADGTVVVSWYYRAMGATVGKDTWLPSDLDVGNYDNLIIGSNVTIGGGCSVGSPYIAPAGLKVSAWHPGRIDRAYIRCGEQIMTSQAAQWMAELATAEQ
jgi:hypothetical protein